MDEIITKECTKCLIHKPLSCFSPNRYWCKDCTNEWQRLDRLKNNKKKRARDREYYEKTKYRYAEREKKYRVKLRKEAISIYGKNCFCCGESRYEFLAIDHINGNGNEERKRLGVTGISFYKYLRKNNWPPGYRVICHNCNMSLGCYGYCPHKEGSKFD